MEVSSRDFASREIFPKYSSGAIPQPEGKKPIPGLARGLIGVVGPLCGTMDILVLSVSLLILVVAPYFSQHLIGFSDFLTLRFSVKNVAGVLVCWTAWRAILWSSGLYAEMSFGSLRGLVRQTAISSACYGTAFRSQNFAEIATAAGIHGWRVDTPEQVIPAISEAFTHPGPALIDVAVARQELSLPPTITLAQVAGFNIYMMKAMLHGDGHEVLDMADTNLWH